MTREEAIKKALLEVQSFMQLKGCRLIEVKCFQDCFKVGEREFPFDPPKRIPPKGAMVKDLYSGRLGYFSGEHHVDNLWIQLFDRMEDATHSMRSKNWIELVEATP